MLLLSGRVPFDQLSMRGLGGQPRLDCGSLTGRPTCLMSGIPGAHTAFGSVVMVYGSRLRNLTPTLPGGQLASEGGFAFRQLDPASVLIVGAQAFSGYGLSYAQSPMAWSTWLVGSSGISLTGCSPPSFQAAAKPRTAQRGPCTGTPAIAGYGAGSARKILDLGSGIVSPSGNLWCVYHPEGSGSVDCLIGKTDFTVPKNCDYQPGTIVGWDLKSQPVLSACQGDAMVQAGRQPIAYGQLAVAPGVTCVIGETTGVRCENDAHHGFALSRAALTAF